MFFRSCTLKRGIEDRIPTYYDTMTSRVIKYIFVALNFFTIDRRRSVLKNVLKKPCQKYVWLASIVLPT